VHTSTSHNFWLGIFFCLFFGISATSFAQETDTTQIEIEEEQEKPRTIELERNFDRPMSSGSMTDMGTYSMPSKTQYYHPPFEGQKSLDRAVEAYFQEMENKLGKNWYWQFLRAVSPYVKLHLGVSEFNSLNIVDRDNPLFKSYNSKHKRQ
jgi:hypothetical protein